jgi:DNA-nicking Smr family endonuclease
VRRRDLSGEERELWALVTRDVKPAKKRARKHAAPTLAGEASAASARKQAQANRTGRSLVPGPSAAKAGEGRKTRPAREASRLSALHAGDPKADRRAAKGLIPIEARLDLHGLSEAAAHARVTRFVLRAQGDGLRLVLVITGKGAASGGEGRGVIRRRFIDWIESPPLRAAIARAAPAKPKDGGQGAFYVFLKRKTRG